MLRHPTVTQFLQRIWAWRHPKSRVVVNTPGIFWFTLTLSIFQTCWAIFRNICRFIPKKRRSKKHGALCFFWGMLSLKLTACTWKWMAGRLVSSWDVFLAGALLVSGRVFLKLRWWFQIFFIFTPSWGRFPFWLISFKRVETTNQFWIWALFFPSDFMGCFTGGPRLFRWPFLVNKSANCPGFLGSGAPVIWRAIGVLEKKSQVSKYHGELVSKISQGFKIPFKITGFGRDHQKMMSQWGKKIHGIQMNWWSNWWFWSTKCSKESI